MPTIVACHQPNFLPWLGFFDKIDRADAFVLLDRVQLIRRSYTTRTTVLVAGQPTTLALPIAHTGSQDLLIADARLVDGPRAGKKLATTLRQSYGRAPGWDAFGEPIARALQAPPETLGALNIALIRLLMNGLGLDASKLRLQSDLDHAGKKSDLMASLTRAAGGDVYLSGGHDPALHPPATTPTGTAADYNDPAIFAAHGARLTYQNFVHPTYDQSGSQRPSENHAPARAASSPRPFARGLSAFDALVRLGPQALALMRAANGRAAR